MEKKPLTMEDMDKMCDQVIKFADKCIDANEFLLLQEVNKFKETLNIKRCEL